MRRAFTLVELLVVIGIIAVLMGILLPSLTAARQQAMSVQCLSNLRQLATAAIQYTVENGGSFPPGYWGGRDWDLDVVGDEVVPGLLWSGQSDPKVQQCPSFDGKGWGPGAAGDPYTGYNYNTSYIGRGEWEAIKQPAKITRVRKASETALFGDAAGSSPMVANKLMRAPIRESPRVQGDDVGNATRVAGAQAYRHRGRTNVAFVDGHAASIDARFAHPTEPMPSGMGFISPDNGLYDLE